MTDREAMKMALAKFEHLWEIGIDAEYKVELLPEIEVLRQALAQPQQEPVCDKDPSLCGFTLCQLAKVCKHTPRNTMPIKIVGPNLEQILNAAGFYKREWVGLHLDDMPEEHVVDRSFLRGARWAEAKLKEKNGG